MIQMSTDEKKLTEKKNGVRKAEESQSAAL